MERYLATTFEGAFDILSYGFETSATFALETKLLRLTIAIDLLCTYYCCPLSLTRLCLLSSSMFCKIHLYHRLY